MWKKDEPARPFSGQGTAGEAPAVPAASAPMRHVNEPAAPPQTLTKGETVNIGKSVVIKGELSGSEDLTIEGQVEGKIELRDNILTIGPNARIKAQVFAKSVIVLGKVNGNVTASEKVDIREHGSVEGDITGPRVAIADGATFRGSIDMQRSAKPGEAKGEAKKDETKAAPVTTPVSAGSAAVQH